MYTLFYILAYVSVIVFIFLAILKIWDFLKASPLHIRWELYPVPHEGPKRGAYGGSYMEETDWWTKPRHFDHWMDIKSMALEIFCLQSTYEHKPKLWLCSYPFHMGLYLLMGGSMLVVFAVILRLCGLCPENGFAIFLTNVLNVTSICGAFLIAGGSIALIARRTTDKGLHKYTTPEMYANLCAFATFSIITILAWCFNPSYGQLSQDFIYNMLTGNFEALGSFWFVLNMLVGYAIWIWIPLTNMRHILIKYFMYHDIRWGDEATVWSEKNQELINKNLKFNTDWAAPHVADGKDESWAEVATTDPTKPAK